MLALLIRKKKAIRYKARELSGRVLFSFENSPVVFLNGPRQSGKTTLARELARGDYPAEYVSFDNVTHMEAAYASPESFLDRRRGRGSFRREVSGGSFLRSLAITGSASGFAENEESGCVVRETGDCLVLFR